MGHLSALPHSNIHKRYKGNILYPFHAASITIVSEFPLPGYGDRCTSQPYAIITDIIVIKELYRQTLNTQH